MFSFRFLAILLLIQGCSDVHFTGTYAQPTDLTTVELEEDAAAVEIIVDTDLQASPPPKPVAPLNPTLLDAEAEILPATAEPAPQPIVVAEVTKPEIIIEESDRCFEVTEPENDQSLLAEEVTLADEFASDYVVFDLGDIPGLDNQKYGGLTLKKGDHSRLLIAGWEDRAIYEVGVRRNADGHIVGFADDLRKVAETPCGIDGGLAYGPDGLIYGVGYPCGDLYVINGETGDYTVESMEPIDPSPSTSGGAVNFVPDWHPHAGEMRFTNWPEGDWFDESHSQVALMALPGGVEGFAWIPKPQTGIAKPSIIMSEWSASMISLYEVDEFANPIPSTRRTFASNVSGAEGAFFDPLSGDFLFSTWGGWNKILSVRGFVAEEPCADMER